jgi:hypothetical protein
MAEKPSYIGMLNAIAVGESAAESVFADWADATSDKRLAKALRFVAMREGEHGMAFAKRMLELGYEVRTPEGDPQAALRKIAQSNRTDLSKLKALKFNRAPGGTDVFDGMFQDKTLDPTTGGLLGRYIAEERDSVRLLKAEHDRLAAKDKKAKERAAARAKANK